MAAREFLSRLERRVKYSGARTQNTLPPGNLSQSQLRPMPMSTQAEYRNRLSSLLTYLYICRLFCACYTFFSSLLSTDKCATRRWLILRPANQGLVEASVVRKGYLTTNASYRYNKLAAALRTAILIFFLLLIFSRSSPSAIWRKSNDANR